MRSTLKNYTKSNLILHTAFEAGYINRNDINMDFGGTTDEELSHLTIDEIIEEYTEELMEHYDLNWIKELI